MPRFLNPPAVPAPASRYAQAVALTSAYKRVIVSGQVGQRRDGAIVEGIEGQMRQAFANFLAVVEAAGLGPADVVKIVCYAVAPGSVAHFRKAREEAFDKAAPASTYVEVAGLADPAFLVEIEGEAVREARAAG